MYRWYDAQLLSESNSETAECERLAMTYDMFGVHFLQDAWAVGHMWMRWGRTRFTDFPEDVHEVDAVIQQNVAPATAAEYSNFFYADASVGRCGVRKGLSS